jgi:hypothetical protein
MSTLFEANPCILYLYNIKQRPSILVLSVPQLQLEPMVIDRKLLCVIYALYGHHIRQEDFKNEH